jgi:dipeptidyl aminopeptidase/acylaminoacyl peptidase
VIVQNITGKDRPVTTTSTETQMALAFAPDSQHIAYLARPRSGEPFHVYFWTIDSNSIVELTAPSSKEASAPIRWSSNGDRFLYVSAADKKNTLQLLTFRPKVSVKTIGTAAGTHSYSWSPDGAEFLAAMAGSPGTVTVFTRDGAVKERIPLPEAEEIDSFGWSLSGERVMLSLRRSGEEWLHLVQVDRRSRIAQDCLATSADLKSPLPLPDGQYVFQVAGDARTVLGRGSCGASFQTIGPADGILEPQFVKGSYVYAAYSSPERPAELIAIELPSGRTETAYAPPDASAAAITAPQRLEILVKDGTKIPGLLWRSPRRTGQVVVNAHGGPHLLDTSQWDLLTSILVRDGADYLTANYHGTPGYGHSFGLSDDSEQHIREVIDTCEYAVRNLRPKSGRVTLLGASYGAYLAAFVAQRRPDLVENVALLSMLRVPAGATPSPGPPRVRVLQFHGADDDMLSPAQARQATEMLLGPGATSPPFGCFHIFAQEGHTIWRTENVAKMYGSVAGLIRRGR